MNYESGIMNKKNKRHHPSSIIHYSNRGFTLIELLIVISIVAILATIISLNLSGFSKSQSVVNDASKIAFVLRGARDKSISQENANQWGVYFENSANDDGFYALFEGPSYASGTTAFKKSLSPSVKFINPASGSTTTIPFAKVTGLPSGTSSVVISSKSNEAISKTLIINSNGEIQY